MSALKLDLNEKHTVLDSQAQFSPYEFPRKINLSDIA
jgi:hypothetical protein